ncbi:MAG: ferrochelatase [Candidatus Hydrogenedentes bacterium]|nr:ferrochelatase [Candidatus Hydrogenedentota bacterium]
MRKATTGVLLINTGSSSAPRTVETRAYLKQFLSDHRVIDIAAWKRWILVNCFILPFRPKYTAEAYKLIWTERGSPLLAISEDFAEALAKELLDMHIEIGMAYGDPSIEAGMDRLIEKGADRIIIAPMFPQYASATTGAVFERSFTHAAKKLNVPNIAALPPFYDDEGYLDAWQAVAEEKLAVFKPDHVLLSYHGLPERHIKNCDPSGSHCLVKDDCCDVLNDANKNCYRRHCTVTAQGLIPRLGLKEGNYSLTFQSRLGRDPWLTPATDQRIVALAKEGVKRLAVLSPAFTADCLETLEEIGMQAKESFIENGGEAFELIPSLNTHPQWVSAFAGIIKSV